MTKATKEEVTEIKLKRAFNLIKEERYGAARHVLREFPNHPKAQAMLTLIEGKTEKRRGFAAITPRSLLTIGAIITVILMICSFCGLVVFYGSRYSPEELLIVASAGFGDGDAALLGPAITYCKISQDWEPEACKEWPLLLQLVHETAFANCLEPYRGAILLDLDEVLAIRRCLRAYEVPATY